MSKMNYYKLLNDVKYLLTSFLISPLYDHDEYHVHHLNHFLQMNYVYVLRNKGLIVKILIFVSTIKKIFSLKNN